MNARTFRFPLAAGLCFIAGCSTYLNTHPTGTGPYTVGPGGEAIQVGAEYRLPMAQFSLEIRRTLVDCSDNGTNAVRFHTQVQVGEPVFVPGESMSAYYPSLSSWTKTTEYKVESYPSGVIKSVNVAAADHSQEIVAKGALLVANIASLAKGGPSVVTAGGPKSSHPDTVVCSEESWKSLENSKILTDRLDEDNKKLDELTLALESLGAQSGKSDQQKSELETAKKALVAQQKAVAAMQAKLDQALGRQTIIESLVWPKDPKETRLFIEPSSPTLAKIGAMLDTLKDGRGVSMSDIASSLRVAGNLEPVLAADSRCRQDAQGCSGQRLSPQDAAGFIYRSPAPARLVICKDPDNCNSGHPGEIAASARLMVPQLGGLRVLPFKNGAFQNNALTATFLENGVLSSFSYEDKAARASGLLDALSAVADQAEAHKERKDRAAATAAAAELAALDSRLDRLKKEKEIQDLSAELAIMQATADMTSQAAILEADLLLHKAQKALDNADAEP